MPSIKRDRGFIMSCAWHTQMGNNPANWSASASSLFGACMILRQERQKETDRVMRSPKPVGIVSVAIGTDGVERLLTAFALEALLKAVWVSKGNRLVREGRYIGLPCENKKKPKWHNLLAMCDDAEIDLQDSERNILARLSDVARYQGRYPIALRWEQMEPIFYWSEEWDEVIGKLVTKLWKSLGISIRGVPIGGSSL